MYSYHNRTQKVALWHSNISRTNRNYCSNSNGYWLLCFWDSNQNQNLQPRWFICVQYSETPVFCSNGHRGHESKKSLPINIWLLYGIWLGRRIAAVTQWFVCVQYSETPVFCSKSHRGHESKKTLPIDVWLLYGFYRKSQCRRPHGL